MKPNGDAYTYTFHQTVPSGFDQSQTVRVGVYASRNLSEFDLGTNSANDVFTFVPSGAAIVDTHEVVATKSCNRCHDPLAAHGGSRRLVTLCVMCHNPGGNGVDTVDPDTGNSIDFQVMIHKIHRGRESAERGGREAISDHRLQSERERLFERGISGRSAELPDVP